MTPYRHGREYGRYKRRLAKRIVRMIKRRVEVSLLLRSITGASKTCQCSKDHGDKIEQVEEEKEEIITM